MLYIQKINHNSEILSNPHPRHFPLKNTIISSKTVSVLESILRTDVSLELPLNTRPSHPTQPPPNFKENVKLPLKGCSLFLVTPSITGLLLSSSDASRIFPHSLMHSSNKETHSPIRKLLVERHSLLLLSLLSFPLPEFPRMEKEIHSPQFKKALSFHWVGHEG